MKTLKDEEDRRRRLSISLDPIIYGMIVENTTNRSRYIEFALLNYFMENGLDVSKIKL